MMTQEDASVNRELAEPNRQIAEVSKRDSSLMKTVAIMTMAFLPAYHNEAFLGILGGHTAGYSSCLHSMANTGQQDSCYTHDWLELRVYTLLPASPTLVDVILNGPTCCFGAPRW
ncbi:hypothetical protein HD806DRAFT_548783 [Xylariaceae sp. AK1471]|nr:hypothetical protein HD806DRAFT_548783 [Xylariaceae sp. AK1471]